MCQKNVFSSDLLHKLLKNLKKCTKNITFSILTLSISSRAIFELDFFEPISSRASFEQDFFEPFSSRATFEHPIFRASSSNARACNECSLICGFLSRMNLFVFLPIASIMKLFLTCFAVIWLFCCVIQFSLF